MSRTDCLLGAADLYNWEQIRPWVVSARQSGFEGTIGLICYRIADDVKENAQKWDVELYEVEHDAYGHPIAHRQQGSPTQAHNLRFYHAWEWMTRLGEHKFKKIIMTDVRDVIFQTNPSVYLEQYVPDLSIIAPSEGIYFKDEPWNQSNLIYGYGSLFWELVAKDWKAYNVGTIAGGADAMIKLFHAIFRMTEQRHYPSDQSSFNVLIHNSPFHFLTKTMDTAFWAAQMGTTNDPTKSDLWPRLAEKRPIIHADGTVTNGNGDKFCIVHQWDRVPALQSIIPNRYNV